MEVATSRSQRLKVRCRRSRRRSTTTDWAFRVPATCRAIIVSIRELLTSIVCSGGFRRDTTTALEAAHGNGRFVMGPGIMVRRIPQESIIRQYLAGRGRGINNV